MISLFRNPVNHSKLTTPQVRKKWDNRKTVTRFAFSVFSTILILIGLEFSSPNYSATATIVQKIVERSSTLKTIIENNWLRTLFIKSFDPDKKLPIYSGTSLKFTIFFIIFYFVSIHFLSNDPLSNSELLRNLVKKSKPCKPPFLFRWMAEIKYYASQLPSNRLPQRCAECGTSGCGNRLGFGDERKTYHWNSIFERLPASVVNAVLYSTHKCRYIFFLRYSVWFAAALLIPAYILVRMFEWKIAPPVNINIGLIIYIAILWLIGVIIGFVNSVHDENGHGVWGQFSENIGNVLHLEEFKKVFENTVCKYNQKLNSFSEKTQLSRNISTGHEIQRLVTLIGYLDDIVKKKAIRAFRNIQPPGDRDSLRAILAALKEVLFVINHEEIDFRCALFVSDEQQTHLVPLVSIPFDNKPFLTLTRKDYLAAKLSLDSDCIASRAWQIRRPVTADSDAITYFYDAQSEHLKSMIAIPLCIDKQMREIAGAVGEDVDEVIGVLTVDCNSATYFSNDREEPNLVEIMPFANRLIFEMMYSLVKKRG